ncbi:hypothetical protein EVAR_35771_1 [Eumeta japonica]|uniref:Uncharacterized protein n=1 Tax=Eumeta variegata TaxID=151549 RepID=A0A4C1WPY0_EUMVA|nr:hypothetical protein EVAR_35771_1 [Eumeta japonica]
MPDTTVALYRSIHPSPCAGVFSSLFPSTYVISLPTRAYIPTSAVRHPPSGRRRARGAGGGGRTLVRRRAISKYLENNETAENTKQKEERARAKLSCAGGGRADSDVFILTNNTVSIYNNTNVYQIAGYSGFNFSNLLKSRHDVTRQVIEPNSKKKADNLKLLPPLRAPRAVSPSGKSSDLSRYRSPQPDSSDAVGHKTAAAAALRATIPRISVPHTQTRAHIHK